VAKQIGVQPPQKEASPFLLKLLGELTHYWLVERKLTQAVAVSSYLQIPTQ
jgi:hypothetical protein